MQVARLGAWVAVMLPHHKTRATTTEGPASASEGSLIRSSGGRHRRLPMLRHRRRDASYPEDRISDPRRHVSLFHHTSNIRGYRHSLGNHPIRDSRNSAAQIEVLDLLRTAGLLDLLEHDREG